MGLDLRGLPDTLEVCGTCYRLRGPFIYRVGEVYSFVQSCPSDYTAGPPGAPLEKRLNFDFNTVMALCRGCGAVPLEGGSRFSVWFCLRCKPRALDDRR